MLRELDRMTLLRMGILQERDERDPLESDIVPANVRGMRQAFHERMLLSTPGGRPAGSKTGKKTEE